ncbi:MAG: carbon-nitrogen hydrolase family protein [Longimicrobiales bacterium]|nr:carbon-nitrogen hydrolase family protein [Longimicrobiales bacterium]
MSDAAGGGPAGDDATLTVALITEVFHGDRDAASLRKHLAAARKRGAALALLPELPLNDWAPATRTPREEDAEFVDGPRQSTLSRVAREAGIAVVGGAIILDPVSGARHNTALLYKADGTCLARYRKLHLPHEEGYWERSHYGAGGEPPEVVEGLALRVGLQICSDVNRPEGIQLLAAQGAEVILAPRATPPETYERWKMVLRANAVMSGAYVLSANRPRPEGGASIGGPSLAIDPSGDVIAETTEPVRVVTLRRSVVRKAARDYPGYLKRFPEVYARGWRDIRS